MISDARPVGTSCSAKNSTAFAPGRRQPITTHDAAARTGTRIDPPGRATTAAMIAPAATNRVETARSVGSVSIATAIARHVEPQIR